MAETLQRIVKLKVDDKEYSTETPIPNLHGWVIFDLNPGEAWIKSDDDKYYYQTVTSTSGSIIKSGSLDNLTAENVASLDVNINENNYNEMQNIIAQWSKIYGAETSEKSITIFSIEPTTNIIIQVIAKW